jgi:carboxylate-amine ligase
LSESVSSEPALVGVEEEFLLIDAQSRLPAPRIATVLGEATARAGDRAQEELHQAQIEHATVACGSLDDLRTELFELRRAFVAAAAVEGSLVVASGTYQGAMGDEGRLITSEDRYEQMAEANSILAREQLICGCHIHVSIPSPDRAIDVMNRVRAWLPCLLALSANSPFWEGEDTGFASYRTEVWSRWPTSGPPHAFASHDEYQELLQQLIAARIIVDEKMAYWDIRPSEAFPTVEIRVNDVMPVIDDVVAVAAIARALVAMSQAETDSAPTFRWELLRAANWRAARSGLSDSILSPVDGKARPAGLAVSQLLAHVAPALRDRGEYEEVEALTTAIVRRGNGATRQRSAFARRSRLEDVVDSVTLGPDGHPTSPG